MIAYFEKMWSPVARQMKKLVFCFFASFFLRFSDLYHSILQGAVGLFPRDK